MKGSDLAREGAKSRGCRTALFRMIFQADLSSAALLVYITESEGLGSAALLAMATAFPWWPVEWAGFPKIVSDCENGILTDNEPPAIAAAIRRALILQKRQRTMPGGVSRAVLPPRTWSHKTMEIYGRVVRC